MSEGNFQIKNAVDYKTQCRENLVLADFEERKEKIRDQIQAIAIRENAHLEIDDDLLDEVTSLVEWPNAIIGEFDKKFLKVPSKVLISAMKEHQRYFHLVDENERLVSKFITISNIESLDSREVVKGNERVIRARLSDAAFFFDQDTRTRLDEKGKKLNSIIYQEELGNYAEKCNRISALSAYIAGQIGENVEAATRAGLLCKADLVTDMVNEFPDLQGVMGGYYARHDSENEEICIAIEEHYKPTQSGGELPSTRLGSCLALADKVDSLVGIFGIKQVPTGSKDPFALRRQSLGVIRMCIEQNLDFSLDDFLVESSRLYGNPFEVNEVRTYIIERMTSYYQEEGVSSDIVASAVNSSRTSINLVEINKVIRALLTFRDSPDSEKVISMNKRIGKLLDRKIEIDSSFDEALITNSAEKKLFNSLKQLDLKKCNETQEKLARLASLQPLVDKFFEDVMVMTNDKATRNNRISLLQEIRDQFLQVADFSLLR
jgi:glycyl-tRNA synthetase beta chain